MIERNTFKSLYVNDVPFVQDKIVDCLNKSVAESRNVYWRFPIPIDTNRVPGGNTEIVNLRHGLRPRLNIEDGCVQDGGGSIGSPDTVPSSYTHNGFTGSQIHLDVVIARKAAAATVMEMGVGDWSC